MSAETELADREKARKLCYYDMCASSVDGHCYVCDAILKALSEARAEGIAKTKEAAAKVAEDVCRPCSHCDPEVDIRALTEDEIMER